MGLGQDNFDSESSPVLAAEAAEDVHRVMRDIPDRQIIDFLVQFFVREISWYVPRLHPSSPPQASCLFRTDLSHQDGSGSPRSVADEQVSRLV